MLPIGGSVVVKINQRNRYPPPTHHPHTHTPPSQHTPHRILHTLLAELMRKAMAKNTHPKLLLRRTESIAEKMLANWLAFLLFPYILVHVHECVSDCSLV